MIPRRGIIAAGLGGAGIAGLTALGAPEALAATGGMQSVKALMPTGDTSGYTDTHNLYMLLGGQPESIVTSTIRTPPTAPPPVTFSAYTSVVLGPGQFYFGYGYDNKGHQTPVTIPLKAGNQSITGMGTAGTYCYIGTTFPSATTPAEPNSHNSPINGVFEISGSDTVNGDYTISGIRFCGKSSKITDNPAASPITVDNAARVVLEDLAFEYINGWMIDYKNPRTDMPVSLDIRGIRGWFCAGGIRINGYGNSVGASLIDCETVQLGVSEGPFQNLDAFYVRDAHDLTGTNLNFSNGYQKNSSADHPYGHGFHIVGDVANVLFDVINCSAFYYPLPGNGQCGLLIEDGPGTARGSHINFSHAMFRSWDIGFNLAGTGYDITLDHCVIGSNQTHGGVIGKVDGSMGGAVLIDSCRFGSNGLFDLNQTGPSTSPTPVYSLPPIPVYDLNIRATSAHAPNGKPYSGGGWGGTVRFCRFNSTISSEIDTPGAVQCSVFIDSQAPGLFRFEFNEFASEHSNYSRYEGPSLVVKSPS
jgi:hypothetical protein